MFERLDLLQAALIGFAVGDAMGVPYEFMPRDGRTVEPRMVGHGSHDQPAGTFSDDTSMTLATIDSIQTCGRIDVTDMRHRFEAWLEAGEYAVDGLAFDCGTTVRMALHSGRGRSSFHDNGNGSLMRILPLAFTDATDREINEVSAITHAHPLSCMICRCYVNMVRLLVTGMPLADAVNRMAESYPQASLDDIALQPRNRIRSSGFVFDTIQAAIWSTLNSTDYQSTILTAIRLGDDTDTIAALAGALAVLTYGINSIPADWLRDLRGWDLLSIL